MSVPILPAHRAFSPSIHLPPPTTGTDPTPYPDAHRPTQKTLQYSAFSPHLTPPKTKTDRSPPPPALITFRTSHIAARKHLQSPAIFPHLTLPLSGASPLLAIPPMSPHRYSKAPAVPAKLPTHPPLANSQNRIFPQADSTVKPPSDPAPQHPHPTLR